MITAIDANILLDILTGSPDEIRRAHEALVAAKRKGELVVSVICYAEVAANFSSKSRADEFFSQMGCRVEAITADVGFLAGELFDRYKSRGGKRTRILGDFLIAAHAQLYANRLLTRDSRFFGGSFPGLKAVAPGDLI